MQVVSGPIGRRHVHFEAPPADQLGREMEEFLAWFNAPPQIDGVLRAGVAHLWFVTIHPFDDGNGRIARAIADQALAQAEASPQRFYSMSSEIRRKRNDYYEKLERTQRGNVDVTEWLVWFLQCFTAAIEGADNTSRSVMRKADFWRRHASVSLSDRQRAMLNRLLDGFDGKLTSRKWAALTKVSIPTAQRDITELVAQRVLVRNAGGSKNTSYDLAP